jgi:hypothetical protein
VSLTQASGGPQRVKEAATVAAFYTILTLLFIPQVYFYNYSAARHGDRL